MGAGVSKRAKTQLALCRETGGTELNLSECELRKLGSFKSIVRLKLLVRLNLSHNYLQALPLTIKKLINLEELDVSYNEVQELPYEICLLSNLKILRAEADRLSVLPDQFSRLTKLTELSLAMNRIQRLPSDFSQLPITSLDLSRNDLSRLPPQIFQLRNLKILKLGGNRLEIPDEIGSLNLEELDLSDCGLTALSPVIGQIRSLTHLQVQKNELTGFPDEFLQLVNLRIWKADNNQIVHMDNLHLAPLTQMEEIYFSHNKLDHFPSGLGHMSKLRVLDLSHNQLTKIPREVGWLASSMRKVLFGDNKIKTVPGELSFLNPACDLELGGNPLTVPFINWYQQGIVTLMENLKPYLRAYPEYCYVYGDNIDGSSAGQPTELKIQALDKQQSDRLNGGDEFVVTFINADDGQEFKGVVKDNQDGTYTIFFNLTRSGKYLLHITESGEPIKGSPLDYYIAPGHLDCTETRVVGIEHHGKVGQPYDFCVEARDRFGNLRGGDTFHFQVTGPSGAAPKVLCHDSNTGIYKCFFTPGFPGSYSLHITANLEDKSVSLPDSPFVIHVMP